MPPPPSWPSPPPTSSSCSSCSALSGFLIPGSTSLSAPLPPLHPFLPNRLCLFGAIASSLFITSSTTTSSSSNSRRSSRRRRSSKRRKKMGIVFPKKVRGDSSRDLLQDVNNTQFNCDGQSSPLSTTQLQRPDGQSHLSSIEPARHLLSVVTRLYKSPVSLLLRASRKKLLGRKNCTQQHCCSCQELISHYSDNCSDLTDLDSCNERGELWQCSAIEDRTALTSSSSLMFDKEKNPRGSRESPAFVEKSNGAAILRCDMQPCYEKVDGAEKVGHGPTVIVESSVTNAYRQFTFHELSVATSKFSQSE
eukprot:c13900_g1_i2 orf=1887-2807(-)